MNYRKNVATKKPASLPSEDDVTMLLDECKTIMSSFSKLEFPAESFTIVRSAAATCLTIFNGRRGGEPVRLRVHQWHEALSGELTEKDELPDDYDQDTMLVTFQTGKGADHLVPVIFPPDSISSLKYLTDPEIRGLAGVLPSNDYIFASTQGSDSHPIPSQAGIV